MFQKVMNFSIAHNILCFERDFKDFTKIVLQSCTDITMINLEALLDVEGNLPVWSEKTLFLCILLWSCYVKWNLLILLSFHKVCLMQVI